MELVKVTPRGFCIGVAMSIKMAKDARKKYPDKEIYMIGYIVHNRQVVQELTDLGIILKDDKKLSRDKIIKSIPLNSVVILSAHGTSEKVKEAVLKRNLILVDTECEWVTKTKFLIGNYLKKNYNVLFIGQENHPETIAITQTFPEIKYITDIKQVPNINFHNNKPIMVTNQTTLSLLDIEKIIEAIKKKFVEKITFVNDLCNATLERQEAVIKLVDKNIDLLLVIGDVRSSNTNKLLKIATNLGINAKRILDVEDIKEVWFTNINKVAVTAGASTPTLTQMRIFKFINEKYIKNPIKDI